MCHILELVWNPTSYFTKRNDSFDGRTQCNDTQIDETLYYLQIQTGEGCQVRPNRRLQLGQGNSKLEL